MNYCKDCIKEIDTDATICPYCRSPQRPLARAFRSPLASAIIYVAIIGVFFLSFGNERNKYLYDPAGLSVTLENMRLSETDCGPKLVYFGELSNANKYALKNIQFNLEALNEEGELIEVFSENKYSLIVPPNGNIKFKLASKGNSILSVPNQVKVKIVKAQKI